MYDLCGSDLDNDGDLDLIGAEATGVFIHLGNGNGSFQSPSNQFTSGVGLDLSDFNGDNILDLSVGMAPSVQIGCSDRTSLTVL